MIGGATAIIGFGLQAERAHLPTLRDYADNPIAAIVDPSPVRQDRARQLCPDSRIFESIDVLLRHERPSIWIITTPPHARRAAIQQALGAEARAVVCEKPLCLSATELRALRATHGTERIHMCHNWRHSELFGAARAQLCAGSIGRVQLDPAELIPPQVVARLREPVPPTQLLDRQARLGLPKEPDDLRLAESFLHVRSPFS